MSTLNQRLSVLELGTGTGTGTGTGSGTETLPQIYFKITSNLGTNQIFSTGTIAKFNNRVFCSPTSTDFNTSTYKYTVPIDGIYQFTYSMYPNYPGMTTDTVARFSININGSDVIISGSRLGNIETATTLESCVAGDIVCVKCSLSNTTLNMWMSTQHSWFTGHLISTL